MKAGLIIYVLQEPIEPITVFERALAGECDFSSAVIITVVPRVSKQMLVQYNAAADIVRFRPTASINKDRRMIQ